MGRKKYGTPLSGGDRSRHAELESHLVAGRARGVAGVDLEHLVGRVGVHAFLRREGERKLACGGVVPSLGVGVLRIARLHLERRGLRVRLLVPSDRHTHLRGLAELNNQPALGVVAELLRLDLSMDDGAACHHAYMV